MFHRWFLLTSYSKCEQKNECSQQAIVHCYFNGGSHLYTCVIIDAFLSKDGHMQLMPKIVFLKKKCKQDLQNLKQVTGINGSNKCILIVTLDYDK